ARAAVVISDGVLADRYWPNRDPVGQRLILGTSLGADPRPRTIVGIAGRVRTGSPEGGPQPAIYLPYSQNPWPTMTLVARTTGDPAALAAPIRGELFRIDRNQPVTGIATMDEVVARSMAARRFQAWLVALFALLSLVQSMIGIYGVTTYGVAMRTQEFGIRLALGARRIEIVRLAVGAALRSAMAGGTIGLCLALVAAQAIRAALFGITPADLPT